MTEILPAAQTDALIIIKRSAAKHERYGKVPAGGSYLGRYNNPRVNTVHWRAAEALAKKGLVEIFLGPDGRYARLLPGCEHDDCDKPVVYRDGYHSLCDNHYTNALEHQGGAHDGCCY